VLLPTNPHLLPNPKLAGLSRRPDASVDRLVTYQQLRSQELRRLCPHTGPPRVVLLLHYHDFQVFPMSQKYLNAQE